MSLPGVDALRSWLRRPRGRLLLGLLLLAVGVRIALPYLLRPQIVARADAALVGRIALADLDLSLIRGGVTLHGLEVYADELPAPDAAPASAPAEEPKPPLFAARTLWTQISWLALFSKTIEVEELALDGFTVRLDRLKDGMVLPRPVPSQEPEKTEPEEPSGWSFAADSVALTEGKIFFRDFTVGDAPQQFDLEVKDLSAKQLALVIDPAGREPGHVAFAAQLGEGRLGLDSTVESKPEGPAAVTRIALANLPIGGVRAYLTMFGWSDLTGTLDSNLEHRFETGGAHEISGSLSLSDVAVRVPDLDRPALAWKKLGIGVEKIDVVGQSAAIAEVGLEGAQLVVAPKARPALPLITPRAGAAAPAEDPAPAPAAQPKAEPSKPWSWRVARVGVKDSSIDVLGSGQMLPIALQAEVRELASQPGSKSTVKLSLDSGKGTLAVDGAVVVTPLAFDGNLKMVDFSLPPLLAYIDAPGVGLLRSGTARADLKVALAPGGTAQAQPAPTDLRVEGSIGLAGLDVGEPKTQRDFGATWKDLEVGIRELSVPGLIGAPEAAKPAGMLVSLSKLRLLEPNLRITRVKEGILLPPLAGEPPAPTAEPAPPPAPAAESTADAAAGSPSPAPEIKVEVAEARVEKGRAQIVDRTVQPFYRTKIDDLDLKARGVRWPGPVVQQLALAMRGMQGAKLDINGSLAPGNSKVDLKLVQLPLAPFNAYVTPRGYSLAGGTLSLDTKGKVERDSYDTSSKLVISRLDVGGAEGEALFEQNFGIPLSVALGLLKDLNGDIHLAVPVTGDRGGTRVPLAGLIRQALSKALVGALASPLKLFGAVTADGKVQSLAPEPIAFPTGSSQIGEQGRARIEQLAGLLASSPGVALTLRGATSPEDERWVKEQALLEELRASSGLRSLGKLGEIGTRSAVREHLEAQFAGQEKPLDPDAQAWLEAQLAQRKADPARLAALAEARAVAARQVLVSEYGIDQARLTLGPPESEAPTAVPGVVIALGASPRASP